MTDETKTEPKQRSAFALFMIILAVILVSTAIIAVVIGAMKGRSDYENRQAAIQLIEQQNDGLEAKLFHKFKDRKDDIESSKVLYNDKPWEVEQQRAELLYQVHSFETSLAKSPRSAKLLAEVKEWEAREFSPRGGQ